FVTGWGYGSTRIRPRCSQRNRIARSREGKEFSHSLGLEIATWDRVLNVRSSPLAAAAAEFEGQPKKRRHGSKRGCSKPVKEPGASISAVTLRISVCDPPRNVWYPLGRKSATAPPPEPLDQDEPAEFDEEPEPDAWDEADEL